jgi:hypothetical protein
MIQWEYTTLAADGTHWTALDGVLMRGDFGEALKQLGDYGWELVTAATLREGGPTVFIFKKPKVT